MACQFNECIFLFSYCCSQSQIQTVADNTEVVILLFFIHRETDMRNSILAQVLDQSARARCKCALRSIIQY